jgi:hypothetical protein
VHPDGRWHWDPRSLEGNRRIGAGSEAVERALVEAAKAVTIPTLLVRGASSELVQEEHATDFLKLVPMRATPTSAGPATWWPETATISSQASSRSFYSS